MEEMTLEEEFSARVFQHMFKVLKMKLVEYYETIEMGKLNLPNFLRNDSPEKKAEKQINLLYKNDKDRFLELYEQAYKDLAERGILG